MTTWDDMRYSVLWKAYCFKDETERTVWRDHTDDLTLDAVLEKLMAELRARAAGVLAARRAKHREEKQHRRVRDVHAHVLSRRSRVSTRNS